MVVLLYKVAANTDTVASTRQYTQLNARERLSVGYTKNTGLTLHAEYIQLTY